MNCDIEELKKFINFYVSNYKDIEEELFLKYTEKGKQIESSIYDIIELLTIRSSIVHLNLKYSKDELKEIVRLYEKYQYIVSEEIDQELEVKKINLSDNEYENYHMHKLLTLIIDRLND